MEKKHPFAFLALLLLAWRLTAPLSAAAETLPVGMTAALSGPAKALGLGMKRGIEAAFAEWNKNAGDHNPQLSLVAYDDAYDPGMVLANARRLIEKDKVIALVGNVGTPTAMAAAPYAQRSKVLFFGAMTGASRLRPEPPSRYLIHVRASYKEETAAMVDGLTAAGIKPDEMAFFTQDDAYGEDGFEGAAIALRANGYATPEDLPRGRYARNTVDIEPALIALLQSRRRPRAIIMVAAYRPAAKFITLARQLFPGVRFLNLSFIGVDALADALGSGGDDVMVTQVVPSIYADLPLVAAARAALQKFSNNAPPDQLSLEGYLTARIFIEGMRHAGRHPSRESLVDGLLSLGVMDMGLGSLLYLGPGDHQASHQVWPTRIIDGKAVPMAWGDLIKAGGRLKRSPERSSTAVPRREAGKG